jgi:tetratricopeptide (TPR) repeat protein
MNVFRNKTDMKKALMAGVFALLAVVALAQQASVKDANVSYAQKNYVTAIQQYEAILQSQGSSPELYYNLGNAYFRSGDIAQSILNYNRALLLKPNYEDAKFNLQIAQKRVVDNVDVTSVFFLKQWINDFGDLMSSNGWAVFSIILFVLSLTSFLCFVFGRYRSFRKTTFNFAVASLLIALISLSYALKQSNKIVNSSDGIIMVGSVTAKDSPSLNGKDMFVMHAGTKVTIRNNVSGWTEVELPDGNAGFIPATNIEKI